MAMESTAGTAFTGSLANAPYIHADNHADQPLMIAHEDELCATFRGGKTGIGTSSPTSNAKVHIKNAHQPKAVKLTFCDVCGKGVKGYGAIELHMRRHTGEKPYRCNYEGCDYAAAASGAVNTHIKLMHETDKLPLFFCDLCGKECKTKGALHDHILTHSDKRSYECKICHKYLKNPNSFARHMVSVHKVCFTCDDCGLKYFTQNGLKVHRQKAHNLYINSIGC